MITTTVRWVTMLGAKLRLKVCSERPMLVPPDQPRMLPDILSSALAMSLVRIRWVIRLSEVLKTKVSTPHNSFCRPYMN
jgi:hypothetical protein